MNTTEIKILLVDDHRMMREGVRRVLNEQSHLRVLGEANSHAQACELIRASLPDVVVMDIHLPGENGIEISAAILREFPRIKIVILSADADLATVQHALSVGVSGYVTKNDPPENIVRAIQDAMDHRVYLCPAVATLVVQDYLKLKVNRPAPTQPELTERERVLLRLVAEGKRNKEIADALQVAAKSVETYRSRLMHKLACGSAAELTRYAIRQGIVTP